MRSLNELLALKKADKPGQSHGPKGRYVSGGTGGGESHEEKGKRLADKSKAARDKEHEAHLKHIEAQRTGKNKGVAAANLKRATTARETAEAEHEAHLNTRAQSMYSTAKPTSANPGASGIDTEKYPLAAKGQRVAVNGVGGSKGIVSFHRPDGNVEISTPNGGIIRAHPSQLIPSKQGTTLVTPQVPRTSSPTLRQSEQENLRTKLADAKEEYRHRSYMGDSRQRHEDDVTHAQRALDAHVRTHGDLSGARPSAPTSRALPAQQEAHAATAHASAKYTSEAHRAAAAAHSRAYTASFNSGERAAEQYHKAAESAHRASVEANRYTTVGSHAYNSAHREAFQAHEQAANLTHSQGARNSHIVLSLGHLEASHFGVRKADKPGQSHGPGGRYTSGASGMPRANSVSGASLRTDSATAYKASLAANDASGKGVKAAHQAAYDAHRKAYDSAFQARSNPRASAADRQHADQLFMHHSDHMLIHERLARNPSDHPFGSGADRSVLSTPPPKPGSHAYASALSHGRRKKSLTNFAKSERPLMFTDLVTK